MEIVSHGPLTVASVVWQPAPHTFALTFACRATFQLAPHELVPASPPEAPNEDDKLFHDDPARGLYAPSDLSPFKVRADVLVVGSAFAPRREPARSLLVRVKVGDVDKVTEAHAERGYKLEGMGPIAPTWPPRRDLLGRHAATWQSARWMAEPLPPDFDPAFFNAAPRDQQLDVLRDDEAIVLENLHPDHPRLTTALPGLRPRARVERRGVSEEIGVRADTLWIDTQRGICTVTWRGRVMLDQPREAGRVVVEADTSRMRAGVPAPAESAPRTPPSGPRASSPGVSSWETMAIDGSLSELRDAAEAARAALPFAPSQGAAPAAAPSASATPFTPPAATPSAPAFVPAPAFGHAPSYTPPPAFTPPAPAPTFSPVAPAAPAYVPAPAVFQPVAPPPLPEPVRPSDPEPAAPVVEAAPRPKTMPREIVKLVWFDKSAPERVRKHQAWRRILGDLDLRMLTEADADVAAGEPPPEEKDRRSVHEVLLRGEAIGADGVKQTVEHAIREDGGFDPPLAVLDVELELPFDELLALKASAALARPLASGDKRLTETLDLVDQLLATPDLRASSGMAESLTGKLREAFVGTKRAVAPDYLDTNAERMLLEQRAYQRRALFDRKWIRSVVRGGGGSVTPVYLPEDLKDGLPMFRRFRVRALAELDMREDQGESSPWAVRVLALGRVLTPAS